MPQERSERGVPYMTLPDRRRNAESIAMSELVKTQAERAENRSPKIRF
jgi:hypothetical protein